MVIFQTYRDIKRIKQIVDVLFKHGLGYIVERIHLKSYLKFHKRAQGSKFEKPLSIPVRLRSAMEELGGGFVKLGQMLSLRKDILPNEYCEEFSKLQDHVKPVNFKTAQFVAEQELKKPLIRVFSSFEKEPLAAASIGQVHRAKLREGTEVVVKIQRPGIKQVLQTDIDLLFHIARLIERHMPELADYRPSELIKDLEAYTNREIDYTLEANNIERFYKNFRYDRNIKIPAVYWPYTTSRILTMEFIDGVKLSATKEFKKINSDTKKVVNNVNEAFLKQVLQYNFFHADPHPGNILVLPNNRFALLDFGIVGRITPEIKEKFDGVLIALIKQDKELLATSFIDMGFVSEATDVDELARDLEEHFADYYDVDLEQINALSFLRDCFLITKKYRVVFPLNVVLLIKSIATIECLNREYNPDFNFVNAIKPIVAHLIKERTSPAYIMRGVKDNLIGFKNAVTSFPKDARKALHILQKGAKVNIEVDHKEVRELTQEMDRSSNRLTFGLINAALIVSASLIISAKIPPLVFGIPLMAHICILLIIFTSLILIISIIKEKGGA